MIDNVFVMVCLCVIAANVVEIEKINTPRPCYLFIFSPKAKSPASPKPGMI
jgi:hypothetical protein